MKKSLFFIAMMLVAFTAYAQDKKDQDPKEKFFQARVKEMVFRLKITDEQKPEFEKVYKPRARKDSPGSQVTGHRKTRIRSRLRTRLALSARN